MNFWRDLKNATKSWGSFIWFLDEHVNHAFGRTISRRFCDYNDRLILRCWLGSDTEWVVDEPT